MAQVCFGIVSSHMAAAVADCFSTLKSFRKKSPYCLLTLFSKSGGLPIFCVLQLGSSSIFPSQHVTLVCLSIVVCLTAAGCEAMAALRLR